jgi:glycosyltransferase involved in cell wall biosynthesis
MTPLRLIIFAGYYHPYRGGYVESIHGLAKGLVANGAEVTVVTPEVEGGADEEIMDGVRIVRLPSWHILNGTYPMIAPNLKALRMLRKLWREPFDVVSTQTRFFVTSFVGAWFAFTRRIPLLHTERGAYHSVVTSKVVDLISRTIDHTLGWAVIKVAKKNVGVSQAACEFLKHLGAFEPVFIPNGVTIPQAVSDKERLRLRKKWKLKEDDRVLLFLGRLIHGKGCQDVLPGFAQLLKQEPKLKFVIAGDGPYREELKKEVRASGFEKQILFLGTLNGEQVQAALNMADWFVNPSHSEGLPRSVLEAAATGLPIVATDVGGTKEIIENGKSGLIVPAHDAKALENALEQMISDDAFAKRMGEAAAKRAQKHFAWPTVIHAYEQQLYALV